MHSLLRSKVTATFFLLIAIMGFAFSGSPGLATRAAGTHLKLSNVAGKSLTQPQLKCGDWNVIPSPTGANKILFGVAAASTNDAWAVGYTNNGINDETLAEHWNGASWNIVPSPNPGLYQNILRAVATTSADDAWTVGSSVYSNNTQTLIEHWDGTSWSVVPSLNTGSYDDLYGVTALSPSDVWAVGYFSTATAIFLKH
jgi:hypothetical protein